MKIGIGAGGTTLAEHIASIQKAEADGFASVWMPNIFGFDAIMTLALAGAATSTIELGTFVVPTYPRHPTAMAQQGLTAAAATNGRFTLGIGLSHKLVIEDMFGLDYSRPIRHMREYLSVLIPALDRQPIRFHGEEYRVAAQFDVPIDRRPPVIVAALGPPDAQDRGPPGRWHRNLDGRPEVPGKDRRPDHHEFRKGSRPA